jgi:quercetin dioxygenase-like cupin family protein
MHRATLTVILALSTLTLYAQSNQVEITSEPSHHLAFENDQVRVFKVEVAPHKSTLMHWHRHDYLFVTLGDAHVSNQIQGRDPIELNFVDGDTRFVSSNFAHIAQNLSDKPFRNVTIELLKDEEAHKTPPYKWDEERGLNVFNGGTQHILFVQDGVRVSEVDLQPGGIIPSHHHNGPHLVVAVSDLDLRSDVEGQGQMQAKIKSGDSKWVAGGFTHTVTNIGKQPAKFIALEFPK